MSTVYPLLLAKLKYDDAYRESLFGALDRLTEPRDVSYRAYALEGDILSFVVDTPLVNIDYEDQTLTLTQEGERTLAQTCMNALFGEAKAAQDGAVRANRNLWTNIIVRGGQPGWYDTDGISHNFIETEDINHLLICGIDEERSRPARHGSWESFLGTFVEEHQRHEGIYAYLSCRCDEVDEERMLWSGVSLAHVMAVEPIFT